MNLTVSKREDLAAISSCFALCFPQSFAVLLGQSAVAKSLEWLLQDRHRFLIHLQQENEVIGFVGGFTPQFIGDGAKSGMLRHSFSVVAKQFVKQPWLFAHKEVRQYGPSFIKNHFLRLRKRSEINNDIRSNYLNSVIIATIGVHPWHRQRGYAQLLLQRAEEYVDLYKKERMHLSVKLHNAAALNAYLKAGWKVTNELKNNYELDKIPTPLQKEKLC